jgi:hypothetical protein
MGIGGSILLIVIGLILALALHLTVAGVDIQMVGWILVAAGVAGLVITYALIAPRRRRTVVVDRGSRVDPSVRYAAPEDLPGHQVVRERTIDEGPL